MPVACKFCGRLDELDNMEECRKCKDMVCPQCAREDKEISGDVYCPYCHEYLVNMDD